MGRIDPSTLGGIERLGVFCAREIFVTDESRLRIAHIRFRQERGERDCDFGIDVHGFQDHKVQVFIFTFRTLFAPALNGRKVISFAVLRVAPPNNPLHTLLF